ncbi:MAG: hypothetical protein GX567_04440 [Clostridia bacterium]|nr:hypothetical protein [Clostridia bacterium]
MRSLLYIGRVYEQLVSIEDRYKRKLVKLPTPEFYTFYNGIDPMQEQTTLSLSDAFFEQEGIIPNMLQLNVHVINIKPEQEHSMLDKCEIMKEYALFIECVEKYKSNGRPNAIERAVKECIDKGILSEYLKRKGSEVVNMLIAEYDYETDIRVQRQEEREDALEEGMVRICKSLGISKEITQQKIQEELDLSEEEAEEKVSKYWKE